MHVCPRGSPPTHQNFLSFFNMLNIYDSWSGRHRRSSEEIQSLLTHLTPKENLIKIIFISTEIIGTLARIVGRGDCPKSARLSCGVYPAFWAGSLKWIKNVLCNSVYEMVLFLINHKHTMQQHSSSVHEQTNLKSRISKWIVWKDTQC